MEGYKEKLTKIVDDIINKTKKLLDSADNGKLLKEGICTVILGKPNAGKSSLMNTLVGEEKAIVTDVAGTTRDVLEETIRIGEIGFQMIDTAGIRNTEDTVEKIGVKKAVSCAKDADLILYVVDSSIPLDENDFEIFDLIKEKKTIILLNKADLSMIVTEEVLRKEIKQNFPVVRISMKEQTGIEDLEKCITDMFFDGNISFNDQVFLTNLRQKEAIQDAYDSLIQVKKSMDMDMPEDFYSIDLMSAYSSLGFVIGEEVGEDLVNEIFSKFCMGK